MKEISTLELKKLINSGKKFTLLDCRGVDYYNWEHIPGAINLRWKYVEDKAAKILSYKKVLIVTYCDGFLCSSSIHCYKSLKKLGYTNLIEYAGGMADWNAHSFPTVRDPRFRLAENIYRFPNQEFYGEQVNSYFIEEKDFYLLIDGPQQLTDEHEDFITFYKKPIKIFMSHNPTAGEVEKLQKEYNAKIYLHKNDKDGKWLTVKPDFLIDDGFEFSKNLTVIHTPGHSKGSATIYDKKNKILFTGDHIEGDKKGGIYDFMRLEKNSNDQNLDSRLKSTSKLLKYDFNKILPFHYEPILKNAKEILKVYIQKYENINN